MLRSRKAMVSSEKRVKIRQRRTARMVLEEQRKRSKGDQRKHWAAAVASVWAQTRRDADLTQDALAKKLDVSRDTIAAIEAGTRRVTLADVILLAGIVGIDPRRLVDRILRW
jgi:DNA-binding XRE family transcriptional regulator